MKRRSDLSDLEAEFGPALEKALAPGQAPPDAVERIRRRVHAAAATGQQRTPGLGRLLVLPRHSLPDRRRPLRWVAAAVAAVLLFTAGGPGAERLSRRWFGPRTSYPIAAPFPLAGVAEAAGSSNPALPQVTYDQRYKLAASLPALPASGTIQSVHILSDGTRLKEIRRRLGISEPVKAMWDKIPYLTHLDGYRAGPFTLSGSGAWTYETRWNQTNWTPPAPDTPATDAATARSLAEAWLRQAGLYPDGPLTLETEIHGSGRTVVSLYPADGSPLSSAGDYPGIRVAIREGKVESASGIWPDRVTDLAGVPLRTAEEAWADLQAGIGAVIPIRPEFEPAPDATATIREVRLDRALVRSLDEHWYFIPVVRFIGELPGVDGQQHTQSFYVSAIKPEAGQGGYQLKTDLPKVPDALRAVQVSPDQVTDRSVKPNGPTGRFLWPSASNVKAAARQVATAAGISPAEMGEPDVLRAPFSVTAAIPLTVEGMAVLRSDMSPPQAARQVAVVFRLMKGVQWAQLYSFPAEPVGEPVPLLTPAEAWDRVRSGAGRVLVHGWGPTFPNAHFAAHRTEIDRVVLAYDMNTNLNKENRPVEPSYFFYGTAEVGEDHREVRVTVILPARR